MFNSLIWRFRSLRLFCRKISFVSDPDLLPQLNQPNSDLQHILATKSQQKIKFKQNSAMYLKSKVT